MNPLCFRSGRSVIAASRVIEVLEDMGLIDPEGSRAWPLPPETDRELARVDWLRVGAPHTGSRDGAVPARVMKELEAMAGSGDDGRLEEVLDRLAWYAPIHFSGERWGVYIEEHAVITLAGRIGARLPAGRITDQATAQDAIRSALYTLYFHEAFHHYVESFAIRVELVEKTSRYVPYHHRVYSRPTGDDEPVEEALACAEMLRRQKKESGLRRSTGTSDGRLVGCLRTGSRPFRVGIGRVLTLNRKRVSKRRRIASVRRSKPGLQFRAETKHGGD